VKGTLTCTPKQLIEWLNKHLDDCPADWQKDDFDGRDGTVIIFNTEEDKERNFRTTLGLAANTIRKEEN
tara:strand:+ start:522 stop:728 length:207 start_codon:yes stop_codon:yes gene_type:complete